MHRDMKLENIMICENGYIKLIDYGLAKFTEKDELSKTKAGTPEYFAPEVISTNRAQDTTRRLTGGASALSCSNS